MSAVLDARGLRAGYGSSVVVENLDITVGAGEIVALLGPNGAGKTTTLLALSGALPLAGGWVAGGEVMIGGKLAEVRFHKRARQGLSMVYERRSVFTQLTVAENLRVSRCDNDRALALFPELEEHLERPVALLSGGQQQMVALARALTRGHPRLLLIDEISLGLAPQATERLLGAVADAAAAGVGVLLVEQHIHNALNLSDRVLVMRRGQIVLSGVPTEFHDNSDKIQDAYLTKDGSGRSSAGR